MRGETVRLAGLVAAAVVVLATGVWLTQAGKPYSTALLSVHKLVVLGILVVIGVVAYRAHQATGLTSSQVWLLVGMAVLAVAAFASGGVASATPEPPAIALWVHRAGSWLAAAAMAASVWVLSGR